MSEQLSLFEKRDSGSGRIINVASVPQRSPFRYPGGKTWLVPRVRQWLTSLPQRPALFIEPFAGGGIVSLTVAAENLAGHVIMIELDHQVAAVWRAILEEDGCWLTDKIVTFDLTMANAEAVIAKAPGSLQEKAFQTILKNRIYREVPRTAIEDLRRKLDSGGDRVMLVDVRSHGYYDAEAHRIQGSVRLEPNNLAEKLHDLPKDREIYLYCT